MKLNLLRKVRQTLALNAAVAASLASGRRPEHLFRFDGGIGDKLLCTTLCRELAKRGRPLAWMLSEYPELFRNNPDVAVSAHLDTRGLRRWIKMFELPERKIEYAPHADGRDFPPPRHVITEMCCRIGLTGEIERRPYVYLTAREKHSGQLASAQIVIQSSGLAAKYPKRTKEWFPARFQEVVNYLRPRFTLVQLGAKQDPLLDGAVDLRGKTSVRQSAAILHQARLFIGLAGFLKHLARSVDCPAVIVYGGEELPMQTGYSCNENLTNQPSCSPCWRYACSSRMECMSSITARDVIAATERLLSCGRSLSVDREVIPLPSVGEPLVLSEALHPL